MVGPRRKALFRGKLNSALSDYKYYSSQLGQIHNKRLRALEEVMPMDPHPDPLVGAAADSRRFVINEDHDLLRNDTNRRRMASIHAIESESAKRKSGWRAFLRLVRIPTKSVERLIRLNRRTKSRAKAKADYYRANPPRDIK